MADVTMRDGIEIGGVFYPWREDVTFRAATQAEIDAENAMILEAYLAGEDIG